MSAAQRWRAPEEDGGILVDPPFREVPRLLDENRQRLAADCLIMGRPLREWRQQWSFPHSVLCGHQPELFHPGVWAKNFAVNGIARRHGLTPVNLIIDTDTIKSTSLPIPVFDADPIRVREEKLAFDRWEGEAPYQTRRVVDRDFFSSLVERANKVIQNWGFKSLLPRFWSLVCEAELRGNWSTTVGQAFALARAHLEQEWGCKNQEPELSSALSQTGRVLIAHVLDDLPRFHALYNSCLHAFRRQHRLRSRTHPVPDLALKGDLLESPFWLFDVKSGRRGHLLVRQRGEDQLDLFTRPDEQAITIQRHSEHAFDELKSRGLFVQTRALMTTMFARLFLCDLFIHGIGGGIYDELTDEIIRVYFGIEPPHYLVVSGTLRLPFPQFPGTLEQCRRVRRELRDLEWKPQRYVNAGELAVERERWRKRQPVNAAARRQQFRALQGLTAQMRSLVPAEEFSRRQKLLEKCEREAAANSMLRRRDYAVCLYPEELLKPFCTQFLQLA